jgi:hypothetical protein
VFRDGGGCIEKVPRPAPNRRGGLKPEEKGGKVHGAVEPGEEPYICRSGESLLSSALASSLSNESEH